MQTLNASTLSLSGTSYDIGGHHRRLTLFDQPCVHHETRAVKLIAAGTER